MIELQRVTLSGCRYLGIAVKILPFLNPKTTESWLVHTIILWLWDQPIEYLPNQVEYFSFEMA